MHLCPLGKGSFCLPLASQTEALIYGYCAHRAKYFQFTTTNYHILTSLHLLLFLFMLKLVLFVFSLVVKHF